MNDVEFAIALIGVGALLTAAFITTNLSRKFGLPSLLFYLGLGLMFGNGGKGDILFDDPLLVERTAELALGLILFKGGYEFRQEMWQKPKILAEGFCLAIVGTLLTALFTCAMTRVILGWGWLESLLLGAILSSTDAAAVFSVFQSSGLKAGKDTIEVLELESSTNDPLAYGLVAGMTVALVGPGLTFGGMVWGVGQELLFGLVLGFVIGLGMLGLTRLVQQRRETAELLWLAVLTIAIGLSEFSGANPLLTAFVAGVVMSRSRKSEVQFWGPLVALSEVVLFLLLGLQVFPAVLSQNLGHGLLVAVILVFLSRPLAVLAVCSCFQQDLKRSLFIAWAGLRGASPIVFGLIPLIADVPRCHEIFAIVFIVVVLSVLLQGSTLVAVAHRLGMSE